MKHHKERKFDGIWNAERVMSDCILYADEFGKLPEIEQWEIDSPDKVRVLRLIAVLKAYARDTYFSDIFCNMMVETCKQEKMDEFCILLKRHLISMHAKRILERSNTFIEDESDRYMIFRMLFRYRKRLLAVERVGAGLLECCSAVYLVYEATNNLTRQNVTPIAEQIDMMLLLLLGENFDRSFTEEELLPYGYPDVTDEELHQMELDWEP